MIITCCYMVIGFWCLYTLSNLLGLLWLLNISCLFLVWIFLDFGKIRVATRRDHDRDDAGETRKTSNSDRREHQRDATVLGVDHGRRGGG